MQSIQLKFSNYDILDWNRKTDVIEPFKINRVAARETLGTIKYPLIELKNDFCSFSYEVLPDVKEFTFLPTSMKKVHCENVGSKALDNRAQFFFKKICFSL